MHVKNKDVGQTETGRLTDFYVKLTLTLIPN